MSKIFIPNHNVVPEFFVVIFYFAVITTLMNVCVENIQLKHNHKSKL